MALAVGTRLGPHEVLAFVGAARFRREAQALAALNHPHIAQIHGLEEADRTLVAMLQAD